MNPPLSEKLDLLTVPWGRGFKILARKTLPTEIVIHESVTTTRDGVVKVLSGKGLSVHFTVDRDGSIQRHLPDLAWGPHAGGPHNLRSIAIEIINPYYPSKAPELPKIAAVWAHRGEYVLPTAEQCEAAWRLIVALCAAHKIPLEFPGADKLDFKWGRSANHSRFRGVQAHHRWDHADGLFVEHYAWLRAKGVESIEAFKLTTETAQKVGKDRITRTDLSVFGLS